MKSETIRKHVLKNAVLHDGKSQADAIIPKLLGEDPKLKSKIKSLMPEIEKIVKDVNKMKLEAQKKELLKLDKHALDKKEERNDLPPIKDIKEGECSFRLPPGPEKQLHVGHALTYLLNNYYAKRYKGKLILRFEDTNPETCRQEFVDGNKEDLKALGITWDKEYFLSDNMSEYYKLCDKMMKNGDVYSCNCNSEKMQEDRKKRKRCKCADKTVTENLRDWNKMKYGTYKEGECVIRLKGDMKNKNSVMWDPVMFRVNKTKHYRQGSKYSAWPMYDFTVAFEDAKITHVLRDANWTQRVELQDYIREKLSIKKHPVNVLYSRYQIEGGVTQGRVIRELVNTGVVTGYDDLRLATVKALLRRGILPEAMMELLKEVGITKSKTTIALEKLYTINRRLLDKRVNHYFFVEEPVLLVVNNPPVELSFNVPMNPYTDKTRTIKTNGLFYINKSDAKKGLIRLKHAYNVEIKKVEDKTITGEYVKEASIKNVPIIQWVPEKEFLEIKIIEALPLFNKKEEVQKDSLITHKGYAEKTVDFLPIGTQVQFERFAFCRKEADQWVLTHK
ncbi:MAG: glutamate--tRNA ligase [Nanoarchaeota archaeon]|nr:glutamate--tRNA ligase [Nanoarchaeota archaeon]